MASILGVVRLKIGGRCMGKVLFNSSRFKNDLCGDDRHVLDLLL